MKTNEVHFCKMNWLKITFLSMLLLLFSPGIYGQQNLFTQADRERIISLETTVQMFMKAVDQRFEQIDKRFEQVDKRFEELREDMNKRFEQVDKRFEQMLQILQLIAGIFTALTLGVIGFAYWDRRSILHKAQAETLKTLEQAAPAREQRLIEQAVAQSIAKIEKDGRLRDLIAALRKLSPSDQPLSKVLQEFHLL